MKKDFYFCEIIWLTFSPPVIVNYFMIVMEIFIPVSVLSKTEADCAKAAYRNWRTLHQDKVLMVKRSGFLTSGECDLAGQQLRTETFNLKTHVPAFQGWCNLY